jgi:hypothetical protein
MLIFFPVVFVMSYVSVRAYDSSYSCGKERELSILLGFAWLAALSLCSVPVLIFVPLSNPNRGLGVAVIESMALTLAVCMGLVMSRTKRPSMD